MRKTKLFMNLIFILMLVLTALGNTSMVALADNQDPKADPNLLQLANEHPDYVFPVIVQRELKNKDLPDDDPETAVEKVNGKVNRDQLRDCTRLLGKLVPVIIAVMMDNPNAMWGDAVYPVVDQAP